MIFHDWHFSHWPEAIITASLLLGAIQLLWKRGVQPFWRFAKKVSRAADQGIETFPVVVDMAKEFKNDHGSTLKDNMDSLSALTNAAFAAARIASEEAKRARTEAADAHNRLVDLTTYVHAAVHDIKNSLTATKGAAMLSLEAIVSAKKAADATLLEVKTANKHSIAQLADADETRRIAAIPEADRTVGETEHIDTVPEDP